MPFPSHRRRWSRGFRPLKSGCPSWLLAPRVPTGRASRAFSPPRRGLWCRHGSAAREAGRREPVFASGAGEHGAGGAHGAGGPDLQRAAQGAAPVFRWAPRRGESAGRVCGARARAGWAPGPRRAPEGEETGHLGLRELGRPTRPSPAVWGRGSSVRIFVKTCSSRA